MKNTKITFISLIGIGLLCGSTSWAQQVEQIYPATMCDSVRDADNIVSDNLGILLNSDESIEPLHNGAGDSSIEVYCPVVRQKINTAAGAKFYAYFTRDSQNHSVSCRLSSRRPHNGVLVSSSSRGHNVGTGPTGNIVLARSIAPSATWGHYNLRCSIDGPSNNDPHFHGYRIKEF